MVVRHSAIYSTIASTHPVARCLPTVQYSTVEQFETSFVLCNKEIWGGGGNKRDIERHWRSMRAIFFRAIKVLPVVHLPPIPILVFLILKRTTKQLTIEIGAMS